MGFWGGFERLGLESAGVMFGLVVNWLGFLMGEVRVLFWDGDCGIYYGTGLGYFWGWFCWSDVFFIFLRLSFS